MIVEYTRAFDRMHQKLPEPLQEEARQTVAFFLQKFAGKDFPKGLRVHKCGPFISLSLDMNHRIFLTPVPGGICFVFIGTHRDADRYLKDA